MTKIGRLAVLLLLALTGPRHLSQGSGARFDHVAAGLRAYRRAPPAACESCHVDAVMFQGTPRNCAACHSQGSRIGATPKSSDHVRTSEKCMAPATRRRPGRRRRPSTTTRRWAAARAATTTHKPPASRPGTSPPTWTAMPAMARSRGCRRSSTTARSPATAPHAMPPAARRRARARRTPRPAVPARRATAAPRGRRLRTSITPRSSAPARPVTMARTQRGAARRIFRVRTTARPATRRRPGDPCTSITPA